MIRSETTARAPFPFKARLKAVGARLGGGPLATVLLGAIAGIDNLGNGLAIAALLFAGPLAEGLGMGIGVVLVSAIILAVVVGGRSTQPNAVALVQETTIAILAAAVATAAANMGGAATEAKVATAFAILGAATTVTGLLFYTVGRLRMGGLARFLPYPVIAGFLAGSGWLLLAGSLSMVTGVHGGWAMLPHLSDPRVLAKLVPALLFALAMDATLRRVSHPLAAPGLLMVAGAGFFVVLMAWGIDLEQARAWGWLPQVSSANQVALPHPGMLALVDWRQVGLAFPSMLSAALLSMIGLMLNTSGLELATGRELDAGAELRSTGIANVLAGMVGGLSGYVGLGITLLAERMGARGRGAGLATAAVLGLGLLCAQALVTWMPAFLTAGLVMFLGLELLREWGVAARRKLPAAEWSIVVLIVVVIATIGFLEGLAAGLLVSVVIFVYNYSRLPVVRLSASGRELRSSVDRSAAAMTYLSRHGAAIEVVHLQGYLFFGTADRIVDHVRERLNAPDLPGLRFLILDFRHVGGCDSAAASCFIKIRNMAEIDSVKVLFSHVGGGVEALLRQAGLDFSADGLLTLMPDTDHALELCEGYLLRENPDVSARMEILDHLESVLGPNERLPALIDAMEMLHMAAGSPLISAGETADDVFIVAHGRVKVQITLPNGHIMRLRTMTGGAILGEVALYLQQKRTADVVVETDAVIFRLSGAEMRRLEQEDTETALLAHRLLATNLAQKLTLANRLIQLSHS